MLLSTGRRRMLQLWLQGCSTEDGVRSAAKLNCHLMLPVPVGARWGPDRPCHPRRAVLPSSATKIREFLVFVLSGVFPSREAFLFCGRNL